MTPAVCRKILSLLLQLSSSAHPAGLDSQAPKSLIFSLVSTISPALPSFKACAISFLCITHHPSSTAILVLSHSPFPNLPKFPPFHSPFSLCSPFWTGIRPDLLDRWKFCPTVAPTRSIDNLDLTVVLGRPEQLATFDRPRPFLQAPAT